MKLVLDLKLHLVVWTQAYQKGFRKEHRIQTTNKWCDAGAWQFQYTVEAQDMQVLDGITQFK